MLTVQDGSLITTTEGERCEAAVSNFWRDYQGKEIGGPPDPHYPKAIGMQRTILSAESSVMDSGDWAIVVGLGPPFPYFDERTFYPIPEEYEGFPMYFKPHF
ncbi:hypothetical protein HY032_03305 [Candidatus Gottesmanbacteria bacterium]|nr:hypothetical protein [Candidatus Gottesmanbacteria bacterium]